MKKSTLIFIVVFLSLTSFAQQPKIISDCTITYSVIDSGTEKQNVDVSKIIYLKGKDLRSDLLSSRFSQTIFYNGKTGNVIVLKTIGQSKYISYYNAEEWKKQNEMYNGLKVLFTGNTKTILNHECKEAVLTLNNGNSFSVYYWSEFIPSVQENLVVFKDIPGIILQYESQGKDNRKIMYTATAIDFDPVPTIQFEIPAKGYRVLK